MSEGCGKDMKVYFDSEYPEKGFSMEKCQKGFICSDCTKIKRAIEEMKINFPKTFGMTFEDFEKRISTPEMKILVRELRKRFGHDDALNVVSDEVKNE